MVQIKISFVEQPVSELPLWELKEEVTHKREWGWGWGSGVREWGRGRTLGYSLYRLYRYVLLKQSILFFYSDPGSGYKFKGIPS